MISRTGNNPFAVGRGFTLLEVIVTTVVLSLGAVFIYEALFICLDSFSYYSDYLSVASWMDEKIWQAQDSLMRLGAEAKMEAQGRFEDNNRGFQWNLEYYAVDGESALYRINLTLASTQQARRKMNLSRTAYAQHIQRQ